MIRLIIMASALSLAAAKTPKSTKLVVSSTPRPTTAKSVKSAKAYASVSMSTSMSLTTKSAKLTTKSAKLSKSSKSGTKLIASFGCANPPSCISAENVVLFSDELQNAVTTCDATDEYQKWDVYFDGDSLKMESTAHNDEGMCLAIIDNDCDGGKLGLAHCGDDESSWYLEGGNLVSLYCWEKEGKSTAMSADGCTNLIALDTSGSGSFTTSEKFMFFKAED